MRSALAVFGLVLAGHGGFDDGSSGAVDCVDLFAVGVPAPVADDAGVHPCGRDGETTLFVSMSVSFECDDGRVLHQTDEAWWIEGESVVAPLDNTFENIATMCGNA